jgi:tetratricopeptide (TPR) repeat protein
MDALQNTQYTAILPRPSINIPGADRLKKIGVLLLSCISLLTPASACINSYEEALIYHQGRPDPKEAQKHRIELEKKYARNPDHETANDYAVALLYVGEPKKAIALLQQVEKMHAGAYRTAANLGTAYELDGQDALALAWIKEGVRRNPKDHEGTEWLHVKILEAKLAIKRDPRWLDDNNVLGIDFGKGTLPEMPSRLPIDFLGAQKNLKETRAALSYQLDERLKFVDAPEPVVGDLFHAWANIAYLSSSDDFNYLYDSALRFGVRSSDLVRARASAAHDRQVFHMWFWPVLIVLLLIAGLVTAIRISRRKIGRVRSG